jgi:hypothetical protein
MQEWMKDMVSANIPDVRADLWRNNPVLSGPSMSGQGGEVGRVIRSGPGPNDPNMRRLEQNQRDAAEDNRLRLQYEAMFGKPREVKPRWAGPEDESQIRVRMIEQRKVNDEWSAAFEAWKLASAAKAEEIADRLSRKLDPTHVPPGSAWKRRL